MTDKTLHCARNYEKEAAAEISKTLRPKFHMTPYVGWTNDPNGFSFYNGKYHLFYQSNPYGVVWDSMHWGHVVSKDLLHWEYLPCAMAPDQLYDSSGCFSGSAIELDDGRQLIMYTGVSKESDDGKDIQTQCIAIGDGIDYQKYSKNPVLDRTCLPEGLSRNDFRDPKIWRETDGSFRCVVGARKPEKEGSILLFSSRDGFSWEYESVLIENNGKFGLMWECPDFFELDEKHILICSPQDMFAEGLEYQNGHGTLCLIGELDSEKKKFTYESNQSIDYGLDFYAPQTMVAPDGRRIMIGWMQNWATCDPSGCEERKWFGQMTLPRELSIIDGRLYQQPIRELEQFRSNKIEYRKIEMSDELVLNHIEGRTIDMEITVRSKDDTMYNNFTVILAQDDKFHTSLSFRPYESILKIDRKYSGSRKAFVHERCCNVPNKNGEIKMRLIMDKYSIEVFINDGERVMTTVITTDISAKGISFLTQGKVEMDITKYELFAEE
ncbi:MAG: glycoside hydrolase family 32 protein [Anaerocolumna sp.]